MKKYFIILSLLTFWLPINKIKGADLFVFEKSASKIDTSNFIKRYKELDKYFSTKKLGSFVENGKTIFRLFAPSAKKVILCLFKSPEKSLFQDYVMTKDEDGVWEISLEGELYGIFYGFKVQHPNSNIDINELPLCVDPYSKAVATKTIHMNPRMSIVVKNKDYNWETTDWQKIDWKDLIIYEMHIRDMTAHKTSLAKEPGTYKGLIDSNAIGGINYIKSLGVNAVEFLPIQEFGYCEIPYLDSLAGKFNTWNPYERNHWGYMTGAFFAPASYYSNSWNSFQWNRWIGTEANQINDFKDVVKEFHKNNIAVIMDVVYNHLSEYEIGNLKQIDKEYYFRLDSNGNYIAQSWCGNDLKTERPMLRRLIIESILYWMTEYKIDGFRFDLSTLIDWKTIEEIRERAKEINPNVILIGEAWGGGGYSPDGFSKKEYAAWNDQIRNGIKGENPNNGHGWIFGKWYGNNSQKRIKSYLQGTTVQDTLGLFQRKEHSVNYLESHDGYSLGDFIRIGLKENAHKKSINNVDKFVKLSPTQTKLNKLAALFLFTSQGITMIHAGQEFARSKIISYTEKGSDLEKGSIDHNSYNKDNETNYINYRHAKINRDLFDYYKGLIELRKKYSAFRNAESENAEFYDHIKSKFAFAYKLSDNENTFVVIFNADDKLNLEFPLPEGNWEILVNNSSAGIKPLKVIKNKIQIDAKTGIVLKQKK